MNNSLKEAIHTLPVEADILGLSDKSYWEYDVLVWHHTDQEWKSTGVIHIKSFAEERLQKFIKEGHNAAMRSRFVTVTHGDWRDTNEKS